ncbi:hypothetical protein Msi02_71330 [Microbispora siamensis]|uniref:Uncharacterized protein n=1 Tax=Microbispora siamensis TaxID=564413 RepID=A0ABQ4GY27_9ACTN|nr:hypothetical protein Msi02_71330 [Microbispora siamensis]
MLQLLRQMYPAWRIVPVRNGCMATRVRPLSDEERAAGLGASFFRGDAHELAQVLHAQMDIAHQRGSR